MTGLLVWGGSTDDLVQGSLQNDLRMFWMNNRTTDMHLHGQNDTVLSCMADSGNHCGESVSSMCPKIVISISQMIRDTVIFSC